MFVSVSRRLTVVFSLISQLLEDRESLLQGFSAYMDYVLADYENIETRDCLFQKSLTEFSHQDPEIADI